jgi:hypothetical protein
MQDDIRSGEIDCVFCWRTSTGEVAEGARDAGYNGRPVRYRPDNWRMVEGLHTSLNGRVCAHQSTGVRLSHQGTVSRMGCFVIGYVTHAVLVPARDSRELEILRDAAREAVLSGGAKEWALGTIHAGEREWLAIHVGASSSLVASLAGRVKASWTLDIEEKVETKANGNSWPNGARLRFLDTDGTVFETLEGDSRFDEAPLPAR